MAPGRVVEFLATLPGPVRAVYEAGPTGFGLARAAVDRGIDVRVVAAGKVPHASGDRIKTDRRDAERLARLLAAGELRFAFVPSVADEQFRDVIRAIEDCRGDLMRARHRLSKMLPRREIRWSASASTWTQKHMNWLRSLRFEDLCSQATFIDYLSGVEMLVARRAALIAALEQVIPDRRHAPTIAKLRCFRGIDTLSAAGLCAEVGDWHRFRPKQLSGFLGVVPTEHTSDQKAPSGSAGCISAGTCWPASAASPPVSSRSPAPASSPPSAERPPPDPNPADTTARPVLPGRARDHRASDSSRRAVREPAMGNHRPPVAGGARS
jgi:transposase